MEWLIEQLLEKYWNGATSVEDEQRIKMHFLTHPAFSKESEYFRFLKKRQEIKLEKKGNKNIMRTWFSAAAIVVGIITAVLVLRPVNQEPFAEEDPEKALEATKKVLMIVGASLNEGQYFTMQITKINKAKEELENQESPELSR